MKKNDELSLFDVVASDRMAKSVLSIDNSLAIIADSISAVADSLACIADVITANSMVTVDETDKT